MTAIMRVFAKEESSPVPNPELKIETKNGGVMAVFKTGDLLDTPGIKIVTACSYLTVDGTLFMGKGLARELKVKVLGIDEIFGRMLLSNGGHLGSYGLMNYEKYAVLQVRRHYDDKPDLALISFGIQRLRIFAEETGYIIHLEYPGLAYKELTPREVGPILNALPDNIHVWERPEGQYGIHSRTQF
jgi:hypothetical protein